MKYEDIDHSSKAFFNIEPKANLKPLPTSEIHVKVDPEPIICIWVPKLMFQGQYGSIIVKMTQNLEESGWIPLVFPTDDSEVKVQTFSSANIEKLDIAKLKETIINEIKGE